jgi:hypothetical protein
MTPQHHDNWHLHAASHCLTTSWILDYHLAKYCLTDQQTFT